MSTWRPQSLKEVFSKKNATRIPGLMRQTYAIMIVLVLCDIIFFFAGGLGEYAVLLPILTGIYACGLILLYFPYLKEEDSPKMTVFGLSLTQNQFIFLLPFTYILIRFAIPALLA